MRTVTLASVRGTGAVEDPTTDRILDAAYEQLLTFGVRRLSVEEVARRVGVARITIYRRFSNKDELLQAVVFREGRRLFAVVDEVVAALPDAGDQIVEGFAAMLSSVRQHPLVQRTLEHEPDVVASLLMSHGEPVIAHAREYLAGHLRDAQRIGKLRTFDSRPVAELMVRLTASFLLAPTSCIALESDDEVRAFARTYLLPVLEGAVHG